MRRCISTIALAALCAAASAQTPEGDAPKRRDGPMVVAQKKKLDALRMLFSAVRARWRGLQHEGHPLVEASFGAVGRESTYAGIKKKLEDSHEVVMLDRLGFNNTYTFVMRRSHARELRIRSVSDLAARARTAWNLVAGFNAEFLMRPDGFQTIAAKYKLAFRDAPREFEIAALYPRLVDGTVDVIDGFATDGRVQEFDLVVLEDDLDAFPPYEAAPLIRKETLARHPELAGILAKLRWRVTDTIMRDLNYQLEARGGEPRAIAHRFLVAEGLVEPGAKRGDGSAGSITIGAKYFGEQRILCHMLADLVEYSSNIRVERRVDLGGTMMCFEALTAGTIDLYVEYTGTGFYILRDTEAADALRPEKRLQARQYAAGAEVRALKSRMAAEEVLLSALRQEGGYRDFVSRSGAPPEGEGKAVEEVWRTRHALALGEFMLRRHRDVEAAWDQARTVYETQTSSMAEVLARLRALETDANVLVPIAEREREIRAAVPLFAARIDEARREIEVIEWIVAAARSQAEACETRLGDHARGDHRAEAERLAEEAAALEDHVAAIRAFAELRDGAAERILERELEAAVDRGTRLRRGTESSLERAAAERLVEVWRTIPGAAAGEGVRLRATADVVELQSVKKRFDAAFVLKKAREDLRAWIVAISTAVFVALLTIIIASALGRMIRRKEPGILRSTPKDERARKIRTPLLMMRRVVVPLVYFVGLVIVLMQFPTFRQLGIAFLASAGVAGVVVGMAARSTLSNVIAGFTICFTQPVRVGDIVTLAGEYGMIEQVGLIYTRFRTWDNRRIMIPNEIMSDKEIVNYSMRGEKLWVKLVVHLDYSADVDKARQILVDLVKESEHWLGDDPPNVWFLEGQTGPIVSFVESTPATIALTVAAWTETPARAWGLRSEVLTKAMKRLKDAGISLPQMMTIKHEAGATPVQIESGPAQG